MKKTFFVLILAIFIVGLFSTTLVVEQAFQHKDNIPLAQKGVLDLSAWDFEQPGYVKLDGEWEFYRDRLIKPGEFSQIKHQQYIKVPLAWEKERKGKKRFSPFGSATYRLMVKIGSRDVSKDYGLKTSLIRLSNSIFINGVLAESSGKPALSRKDYIPGNEPYVIYFKPERNQLELVVQVANFDYASGAGIIGAMYFGKKTDIQSLREKALVFDWIMVSGFFLMGFIFVGFFIQQRKDFSFLYLGLNCLARGFYSFTHGEKTLYWLLPHLSFYAIGKIQFFSATASGIFLVLYMYYAFRNIANKSIVRIHVGLGALMVLLVFLVPMKIHSLFDPLQAVFGSFAIVYTLYLLIRGAFSKNEEAIYLIVAAFSTLTFNVIYVLNWVGLVDISLLPPFEPFIFILSQALLHSMRFSAAFRKVEELSENLATADRVKDEFLAKTSHEFRNPLTGIINISQTLMDGVGGKLTKVQDDNLKLITFIAQRLSRLVNDIQDLVKIQNRELKIHPVALDIKPIVQIIFGFFKYTASGKNVAFVESIPDNLPLVMVDEDRIKQILFNLIDNAIKFSGEKKVEIKAKADKGFVEVWIEDTGPGMPDEILKEIFIPYRQVSYDPRGNPSGIGLGLAIVKELVELHKGRVWAENMHPGVRICFTLPAIERSTEDNHKSPELSLVLNDEFLEVKTPGEISKDGEYTVLAADDDAANLRILTNVLTSENYNVIAVKNGIEALEQFEKRKDLDILVLDLMMPGASGYEVCKKVREKFSLSELPVLIITAVNQTMDMTASYEAGANDFISKPYDLSQLKLKIRSLIMMKQSALNAKNMEVAFLQAQIKPHFLFNTFNTIMSLSYKDVEKAREVIASLADFLRESFDFSNTQGLVSLQKELELVKAYLEVEKARYKERLTVEFKMEEIEGVMLPPITLQTIVENAVKHGIGARVKGGAVRIGGKRFGHNYIIFVEDNGQGMDDAKVRNLFNDKEKIAGVGLLNVQRRLIRYFGEGLIIKSKPGEGTRVEIKIPLTEEG
jgi:two-component system, sensor histidine kinase ChiS